MSYNPNDVGFRQKLETANQVLQECVNRSNYPLEMYKRDYLQILEACPAGKKIVWMFVDLQNDFVMEGGALYIQGAEQTVLNNLYALTALIEIAQERPDLRSNMSICSSQDAHRLDRKLDSIDLDRLRQAAYSEAQIQQMYQIEYTEVNHPFNPDEGKFGAHCIVSSIGADIVQPLQDRLNDLKKLGVTVIPFAKINFSGPDSGAVMGDKKLSELEPGESCFAENAQRYLDVLAEQNPHQFILAGVAGNVCVHQAAMGIKEQFPDVQTMCDENLVAYLAGDDLRKIREAAHIEHVHTMQKPILLYGLSADPVHLGHISIIQHLKERYPQHLLVVMPCRMNPLGKQDAAGNKVYPMAACERFKMLQLALHGIDNLMVCDYEINKQSTSYTVDTVKYLRSFAPTELILVLGADSWSSFEKWHKPDEILADVDKILVYPRAGSACVAGSEQVEFLEFPVMDVSSTKIRSLIQQEKWADAAQFMPAVLIAYLQNLARTGSLAYGSKGETGFFKPSDDRPLPPDKKKARP